MSNITIAEIRPTLFLRKKGSQLEQKIELQVVNSGEATSAELAVGPEVYQMKLPSGRSTHPVFINETKSTQDHEFILKTANNIECREICSIAPPPHWRVHVVQLSHHDLGYTNLPSNVLEEHYSFLNRSIDDIEQRYHYSHDSQMRIVCEQGWSMDYFLKKAPKDRCNKILSLMRSGHIELTAFYGNMVTELCSHESLIRSLYPSFQLKRQYGIPIISAEHNDITGISWGASEVLAQAGVKIFCPGFPMYYNWGKKFGLNFQSFWDQELIFGRQGPGAFWWQTPSGKKILFWCNNSGCGGPVFPKLPNVENYLETITSYGYPSTVIRYPVQSGSRDNSPYIAGFADTIKEWNNQWEFPKLISSTNAMFYNDFIRSGSLTLPTWSGELCGQDYPVGSMSTSKSTAINRRNHSRAENCEKLCSMASLFTTQNYPKDEIDQVYKHITTYEEHTWGYHFPAGPAQDASSLEKQLHAFQAAAASQDLREKVLATIADQIERDDDALYLAIFNTEPFDRSGLVRHPLRELDNCGTYMRTVKGENYQGNYLKGALINDHYHVSPPEEYLDGDFDLIDCGTNQSIVFQLIDIDEASLAEPYQGEKSGLSQGGNRYGFFELPKGLRKELCFNAEIVPAFGYKLFKIVLKKKSLSSPQDSTPVNHLENNFYSITVDSTTGRITSIFDKECKRELIDRKSPFSMADFIVMREDGNYEKESFVSLTHGLNGPLLKSVTIDTETLGHPKIRKNIILHNNEKRIDFCINVTKDSTPLLTGKVAFPFCFNSPEFLYESNLSNQRPVKDYLPGSYSDTVAIQDWVKVCDGNFSIAFCSPDSPIVSLGGNWPGYISPAHSCVIRQDLSHPPAEEKGLKHGWIMSWLYANNFGTNFTVSQPGECTFTFSITSQSGNMEHGILKSFSSTIMNPFMHIFTQHPRPRNLPVSSSLFDVDSKSISILAFKQAESGTGYLLRLWNSSGKRCEARVNFHHHKLNKVEALTITEEPKTENSSLKWNDQQIRLSMNKSECLSLYVELEKLLG